MMEKLEAITIHTPVRVFEGHEESVNAVAIFADGRRKVTGSADKMVCLWDLKKGVVLKKQMVGHRHSVRAVAVSRDGRLIASGDENAVLIAWDGDTFEPLSRPIKAHSGWIFSALITSLDFSPDGTVLATCAWEGSTKLWSTKTWQPLGNPIRYGSAQTANCVRYSPSGKHLAIATNHNIQIWNPSTMTCIAKLNGHSVFNPANPFFSSQNKSLAWTLDGTFLLSAISHNDPTIRVWDTSSWQQVGHPWEGHTGGINAIVMNPAGTFVASASDDKQVRIWCLSEQRTIAIFLCICPVYCITFTTDGKHIFSGGANKSISEWAVPDALVEDPPKAQTTSKDDTSNEQASNKDAPNSEELHQQRSEAEGAIQMAIDTHLDNAPLRLLHTTTGLLCDRQAQISAFKTQIDYKKLLSLIIKRPDLRKKHTEEVVATYFRWAMLSHRWDGKEQLLSDIRGEIIYELEAVGSVVKLQSFCNVARDAGYHWAWIDSCCIDQHDNVELQRSINSMFAWYHDSALTIVYLSDVLPSSKSGAMAKSIWNTRGWTVPEFLASKVIRFYQQDWTLYLDDHSPNHKESVKIMEELEDATGIDARTFVAFEPGMKDAREKLRWASTRVTTVQEDIAYSLFGIFGVQLHILYGEKKQNALGRLLQEIVAQSGDITALDWVGKSSEFNSCLPDDISSYEASPCAPPFLSEDEIQTSISSLRNAVGVESALNLYSLLVKMSPPRFANRRLHLPCISFSVTEVRRRGQAQGPYFTYEVKADGLHDLQVTTEDRLIQFSRARPARQTFVLVRPWDRCLLKPSDPAEDLQSEEDWSESGSPSHDSSGVSPGENDPVDSEYYSRALRLIVRLEQPFGAFLLAQQRGGEYRRIVSDRDIIAQVNDMASVHGTMDVRTLEIL